MRSASAFVTIRKLSIQSWVVLLKFGMPWRTFLGYINGYSEILQISITTQKKICRDLKIISHFYQKIKTRLPVS